MCEGKILAKFVYNDQTHKISFIFCQEYFQIADLYFLSFLKPSAKFSLRMFHRREIVGHPPWLLGYVPASPAHRGLGL
jgi:hypothetical protein